MMTIYGEPNAIPTFLDLRILDLAYGFPKRTDVLTLSCLNSKVVWKDRNDRDCQG